MPWANMTLFAFWKSPPKGMSSLLNPPVPELEDPDELEPEPELELEPESEPEPEEPLVVESSQASSLERFTNLT